MTGGSGLNETAAECLTSASVSCSDAAKTMPLTDTANVHSAV